MTYEEVTSTMVVDSALVGRGFDETRVAVTIVKRAMMFLYMAK